MNTARRAVEPRHRGREIRTRWFGLWDGYLAVAFAVALLFLITGTGSPAGGRAIAIVLLTALVPWYAAQGRPAILAEDRGRGGPRPPAVDDEESGTPVPAANSDGSAGYAACMTDEAEFGASNRCAAPTIVPVRSALGHTRCAR